MSKDAVEGNYNQIIRQVDQVLTSQKENFGLVIDKYLDEVFDQGLRSVEKELSLQANSLTDLNKANGVKLVLKNNARIITFDLMDTIGKEISLFLTNADLNGVSFTNAELKKEVKSIFESKQSRLVSQVITETDRTANQSFSFGYKESGVITHKQWVAVIDGKTTNICLQGNGEIREIGEPFSTGDYQAPFHINCRSRIVGLTVSQIDSLSKGESKYFLDGDLDIVIS